MHKAFHNLPVCTKSSHWVVVNWPHTVFCTCIQMAIVTILNPDPQKKHDLYAISQGHEIFALLSTMTTRVHQGDQDHKSQYLPNSIKTHSRRWVLSFPSHSYTPHTHSSDQGSAMCDHGPKIATTPPHAAQQTQSMGDINLFSGGSACVCVYWILNT